MCWLNPEPSRVSRTDGPYRYRGWQNYAVQLSSCSSQGRTAAVPCSLAVLTGGVRYESPGRHCIQRHPYQRPRGHLGPPTEEDLHVGGWQEIHRGKSPHPPKRNDRRTRQHDDDDDEYGRVFVHWKSCVGVVQGEALKRFF